MRLAVPVTASRTLFKSMDTAAERLVNRLLDDLPAPPPGFRSADGSAARRICSWCGAVLDNRGPVKDGEAVSHAVCDPCAEKWEKEIDTL